VEHPRWWRSRSVFRTRRPWRRRIAILAYVTAFAVASTALVMTVSDIVDDPVGDPVSPPQDAPVAPQPGPSNDGPDEHVDPH